MRDSKARAFLNSVRESLTEIQTIEENIARKRDRLFPGSLSLKHDMVQESIRRDRMAETEADVADLVKTMRTRLETLYDDQRYAEEVISKMERSKHRQVLTLYYLTVEDTYEEAGKNQKPMYGTRTLTWTDVANRMHITVNYARILCAEALIEFEELAHL